MGRIQYVDVPSVGETYKAVKARTVTPIDNVTLQTIKSNVTLDRAANGEIAALKKRVAELELELAQFRRSGAESVKAHRARKRVKPTPSVLGTE